MPIEQVYKRRNNETNKYVWNIQDDIGVCTSFHHKKTVNKRF